MITLKRWLKKELKQRAIIQKLSTIPDREERKKAAQKILADQLQNRFLNAGGPLPDSEDAMPSTSQTGCVHYLKKYIKNAWQGKARLKYLLLFGFVIIPQILKFIVKIIPVLTWPIAILGIPYFIWWYVATWRCAFNVSGGRWAGYGVRTVLVLPTVGLCAFLLWI